MIKTLTAVGNSLGLIIDKPILELLGIDKDTRLEVRTDGEGLIIRPIVDDGARRAPGPPPPPRHAPSPEVPQLDDGSSLDELEDLDDVKEVAPPAPPPPSPPPAPPSVAKPPPAMPPPNTPAPSGASRPAPASEKPRPAAKGDAAAEVVVDLKGQEMLRVPLAATELIIGRDHTADIHLDDRALSRKHAKIERRGAALWVSDLGSANGTYVNGEKVLEPRPLLAGDVIGVGHYRVTITGVEQADVKTPVLTLTGPEGTHRFALVGEQIVIGRSQACDISIGHKSISRRHVRISKESERFIVEDLGSQNGCKLNGKQLSGSAPLNIGDRIDICDFSLTLGYLDEGGPATADAKRPPTMLIDKSIMAQAAYVDGNFENVKSRQAGAQASGPGKADTGEYDVAEKKKPKVVRPKKR